MRVLLLTLAVFFGVITMPFFGYAQTDDQKIAQLREQIEALEKEASLYKSNIASEQAKANSLKKEINILTGQIGQIQTKIAITSKNISKTGIEIEGLQGNIFDAQQKINYQKDTVGRVILSMYKQDQESLIEVLIKNPNLSDFFRQSQYNANIDTALFDLINNIKTEKKTLEKNKSDLEGKKQELEILNQQNKQQNNALNQTKSGKNILLTMTKGQEAAYQKMLADVERREKIFFTELKELETKIIQGGLYIIHVKAEKLPPKSKIFQWPEEDYRLTQGYGMTAYARRGAYGGSPHNGIDLASGFGTAIKAIGDGEIIANGKNDGFGNWVAIKLAPFNLVSVYAHMSAFEFLQVGTKVKMGQTIGYEGSTGNSTGSHLHLSLYREFFTYTKDNKNGQLYFNYFDGSLNPLDYL